MQRRHKFYIKLEQYNYFLVIKKKNSDYIRPIICLCKELNYQYKVHGIFWPVIVANSS